MNNDKSDCFVHAIQKLSAAHLMDANPVNWNEEVYPAEWLYIQRIADRLAVYCPTASENLTLAAHCQHLYRWEVARSTFPEGRTGYYKWRNYLSEYQAMKASEILLQAGYDTDTAEQVKAIVKKENIQSNTEAQTLEDVVCLVFMEFYLDEFIRDKSELNMTTIIRKTWDKMSEKGHEEALKLNFLDSTFQIVKRALGL
ncbi:MAG: DUF4202 domain-containing protein [Prolixibacteraceae bacterium]